MSHDVSAFKWVNTGLCDVKALWMESFRVSCNCTDGSSITSAFAQLLIGIS